MNRYTHCRIIVGPFPAKRAQQTSREEPEIGQLRAKSLPAFWAVFAKELVDQFPGVLLDPCGCETQIGDIGSADRRLRQRREQRLNRTLFDSPRQDRVTAKLVG